LVGCFNLHLHLSFKRDTFVAKYEPKTLAILKWGAVVLGLTGLAAAVSFFVTAALLKIPMIPIQHSLILPGIQSLLVAQEAAIHFFCRRKYTKLSMQSDRQPVLVDDNEIEAEGESSSSSSSSSSGISSETIPVTDQVVVVSTTAESEGFERF